LEQESKAPGHEVFDRRGVMAGAPAVQITACHRDRVLGLRSLCNDDDITYPILSTRLRADLNHG